MILKSRIVSHGWQWLVALHAVPRRSFYAVSSCAMLCALVGVGLVALDAVESLLLFTCRGEAKLLDGCVGKWEEQGCGKRQI